MGDVVPKSAAAETIMADVATTQSRAKARGGKWAELADKMLLNAIVLNATVPAERQKAETELRGLSAGVDAQDDLADRLIERDGRSARVRMAPRRLDRGPLQVWTATRGLDPRAAHVEAVD